MWLPILFLSILSSFVSAKAPHIIVIVSDDQGYNDVSWHNDAVLTPNLADLASRGIILEQHYTQESCSPTRGAFLTGRYRHRWSIKIWGQTQAFWHFELLDSDFSLFWTKRHFFGLCIF